DEHAERAEAVLDAVEEGRERCVVGHVDADPEGVTAELGGNLHRKIAIEIADRDAGAVVRQRSRGCEADAARPAGDRDHLIGQRPGLPPPATDGLHGSACFPSLLAVEGCSAPRWRTRNSVWSRT